MRLSEFRGAEGAAQGDYCSGEGDSDGYTASDLRAFVQQQMRELTAEIPPEADSAADPFTYASYDGFVIIDLPYDTRSLNAHIREALGQLPLEALHTPIIDETGPQQV
ncbi:MAG TPA: hypothetical protein VJP80_01810 [Candidatus Saccharimonadales bacterium]|nr:hypothetical protein [Candidatus Saccharimonadales bacterium]